MAAILSVLGCLTLWGVIFYTYKLIPVFLEHMFLI